MIMLLWFFFVCPHLGHMEVPRLGVKSELSCCPMPQPQQHSIRAVSTTYTAAHGNTGSLTHWARPGIKPATSRFLVGFVSVNHDGRSSSLRFLTWVKSSVSKCFWHSSLLCKTGTDHSLMTCDIFFLSFLRATPLAHGGSQARSQIRATAAGLHHSHSNTRS